MNTGFAMDLRSAFLPKGVMPAAAADDPVSRGASGKVRKTLNNKTAPQKRARPKFVQNLYEGTLKSCPNAWKASPHWASLLIFAMAEGDQLFCASGCAGR
ncbi:hypothetical protein KB874_07340 [Aestuariicoccus sp. KMU-90]|uniref:Uncharacterized protein n=1 Tax=Thetidibacter halocola TaxID=2827239 RepID=A0A8J8B7V6_9RHOB|nr:hypothetical protein [Thetidibacter halocola]